MVKVSGKTKRIVVVGTTLLFSSIALYWLIDWIWLSGESAVSDSTDKRDRFFFILLPFISLYAGLDHWFKPRGKGVPRLSILSFCYYAGGIACIVLFVDFLNETPTSFLVQRLVLPLLGFFFVFIGYWCHRNEED